jgi:predicted nucleic acid-binding protein
MSTEESFRETLLLSRNYELTPHDSSYLELAKRRDLPLATQDTKLRKVCMATPIKFLPSQMQHPQLPISCEATFSMLMNDA